MAIITVTAPAPYGSVPVNTDMIYAIVPDPVGSGSKLLVDVAGGASVSAAENITALGNLVGAAFVLFKQASLRPASVLLNRIGWVSIVPHPQVKDVTQVNYKNHYIPVKATVSTVAQALS